jgi:hypothetical protein
MTHLPPGLILEWYTVGPALAVVTREEASMSGRSFSAAAFSAIATLVIPSPAGAIEEAAYSIVESHGELELRDYEDRILVETVVEGTFDEAGNRAFRRLFNYISGDNRSRTKIDMTAPVTQEAHSEKIEMTAPVTQEAGDGGWRIAFLLPSSYSWDTAPEPTDERVSLRLVPGRRMAAIRFSGRWGEPRFLEHEERLRDFIAAQGLEITGETEYARYDPPFKPWFLRRNEVLIPIATTPH